MSLQMYIFSLFVIFAFIGKIRAARINTYTPLSDQTYQDLLQQQFSPYLQQQQQRQQQQQLQYNSQLYRNNFLYPQQNIENANNLPQYQQQQQQQQIPRREFGRNFKDFNDFQYTQSIPRQILSTNQQLPQYRQQLWTDRPITGVDVGVGVDIGTQYNQPQPQQQFIPNIYRNGINGVNYETQKRIIPYQGINIRPYNNNNNNNDFYGRQNQLGLPSSRDFVQLSTNGQQLNRQPTTDDDYFAHFNNYLRKYPQRLEPQFDVNSNYQK